MSTNPYAPPTANVEDVTQSKESPPIWNPGAAAAWSLFFTPIFGSILHMKNWQALGELEKAAKSKQWALGSVGFFAVLMVLGVFLPESKALDAGSRGAGIGLLVAWYSLSAKSQVAYVKARFGSSYLRKSWGLPILYTVLCFVAFVAVVFVIALVVGALQGEG